jgi:hypothetical protein
MNAEAGALAHAKNALHASRNHLLKGQRDYTALMALISSLFAKYFH